MQLRSLPERFGQRFGEQKTEVQAERRLKRSRNIITAASHPRNRGDNGWTTNLIVIQQHDRLVRYRIDALGAICLTGFRDESKAGRSKRPIEAVVILELFLKIMPVNGDYIRGNAHKQDVGFLYPSL